MDFAAFIARVHGMLVRPQETLAADALPAPPWQIAAREHAIPLIVASAVTAALLSLIFPDAGFAPAPGMIELVFDTVLRIVLNIAFVAATAALACLFAGMFGGTTQFDAGFAVIALAMTPAYVGEALLPLPLLGGVAALVGIVYGLVVLYKGMAGVMGVPDEHRGKHFLLTVVSSFIVSIILAMMLGPLVLGG